MVIIAGCSWLFPSLCPFFFLLSKFNSLFNVKTFPPLHLSFLSSVLSHSPSFIHSLPVHLSSQFPFQTVELYFSLCLFYLVSVALVTVHTLRLIYFAAAGLPLTNSIKVSEKQEYKSCIVIVYKSVKLCSWSKVVTNLFSLFSFNKWFESVLYCMYYNGINIYLFIGHSDGLNVWTEQNNLYKTPSTHLENTLICNIVFYVFWCSDTRGGDEI